MYRFNWHLPSSGTVSCSFSCWCAPSSFQNLTDFQVFWFSSSRDYRRLLWQTGWCRLRVEKLSSSLVSCCLRTVPWPSFVYPKFCWLCTVRSRAGIMAFCFGRTCCKLRFCRWGRWVDGRSPSALLPFDSSRWLLLHLWEGRQTRGSWRRSSDHSCRRCRSSWSLNSRQKAGHCSQLAHTVQVSCISLAFSPSVRSGFRLVCRTARGTGRTSCSSCLRLDLWACQFLLGTSFLSSSFFLS